MSIASDLIRRGHVVYESGDHGETWLELDLLISRPALLRQSPATAPSSPPPPRSTPCGPAGLEVGPRLRLPQVFLEKVGTHLWPAGAGPMHSG